MQNIYFFIRFLKKFRYLEKVYINLFLKFF